MCRWQYFGYFRIPFDCITSIQLPVYDPDEDVTSCRWSAGVECGGVCNGLPESKLDSVSYDIHVSLIIEYSSVYCQS